MPTSFLPTIRNAIDIAIGSTHTLILSSNGEVFGFGRNLDGALCVNDLNPRSIPNKIPIESVTQISAGLASSLFLLSNGDVYGCGRNA